PDELKRLNELHTQAGYLAVELQNIEKSAANGRLRWDETKRVNDQKLQKQALPVPAGLQKIENNMQGFPTLIYDGPFSDHIMNRNPTGLTGSNIDGTRAADIARSFVNAGAVTKYKVIRTENVRGTIPAFRIHLVPQNAKTPVVVTDISKKGGHILSMLSTRRVTRISLPRDRAISIASKFLAGRNIKNMEPTYMLEQQKTGIVIFEYKQDGVLVYPDLMKVKVALDNGEVVGFEGTSFVMNHHMRSLPKPKISEKEALSAVNPKLKISSKRLAVIPLENLQEVQTYEFRGNLNEDTFIVYVNAQTGQEERILKVIDTNSGPVTL
ncbi:MAG: germination protein YpeB, partial [Eubacteriales bacterium]